MYHIVMLRHGESEGNLAGVLQGQSDFPLTTEGKEQAQRLASLWQSQSVKFDLIISSPLLRASQTAEIIASVLEIPVEYDPAWKERYFGQLQGSPLKEIDQSIPPIDFFHPYDPIGGNGESQLDLYIRAGQALQNLLHRPSGSYLVISHGGILNKAIYVILGITPQGHYNSPIFPFANAGYAKFRYNSSTRQWAVISLNNRSESDQPGGLFFWKTD